MSSRLIALTPSVVAASSAAAAVQSPADLVISDAKIYVEDAREWIAEALAERGGKIVFVGTAADAQRLVGPKTRVEKLGGRLVLPGLVESHIQPRETVGLDLDICNLHSRPLPLSERADIEVLIAL